MDINTVKDLGDSYLITYDNGVTLETFKVIDNRDYRKVQEWLSVEGNNALATYTLSELKDVKIAQIKAEAGQRIIEISPEWKQRNYMAAVVDIQNKELVALKANTTYTLSTDEAATIETSENIKDLIFAIRTKSDELETLLDSMTLEQLEAFDPADDNNWI